MPDNNADPNADTLRETGGEGAEVLQRSGETFNHLADESIACCQELLAAAIQSGMETSRLIREFGEPCLDTYNRGNAALEMISQALACRSPVDALALQLKGIEATQVAFAAYMKTFYAFCDSLSVATRPTIASATDVPERMFRAFAN